MQVEGLHLAEYTVMELKIRIDNNKLVVCNNSTAECPLIFRDIRLNTT